MSSLAFIGKFIGCFAAGSLIERYGHRIVFWILSVISIVGVISKSLWWLVLIFALSERDWGHGEGFDVVSNQEHQLRLRLPTTILEQDATRSSLLEESLSTSPSVSSRLMSRKFPALTPSQGDFKLKRLPLP